MSDGQKLSKRDGDRLGIPVAEEYTATPAGCPRRCSTTSPASAGRTATREIFTLKETGRALRLGARRQQRRALRHEEGAVGERRDIRRRAARLARIVVSRVVPAARGAGLWVRRRRAAPRHRREAPSTSGASTLAGDGRGARLLLPSTSPSKDPEGGPRSFSCPRRRLGSPGRSPYVVHGVASWDERFARRGLERNRGVARERRGSESRRWRS